MKQLFIFIIAHAALLSSCKEKNDDFPVKEPDVFFYKTENIAPRDISCMIYNNDHDVFLGSENKDEVLHLGIHGWEVIAIPNPHNINPGINCILYDDLDRLWIGTDHGLFRYSNGNDEKVPGFESRKINCLSKNWLYEVWVGMDAKKDEKNMIRVSKDDSMFYLQSDSIFEKLNVNAIEIESERSGYIGTNERWLYRFFEGNRVSYDYCLPENDFCTCGFALNYSIFCFGTKLSSLVLPDGWTFYYKKVTNNSEIKTVCYSSDTALWIGTAGSGLIRFKEEAFKVYDKNSAKIASDSILSVVPAGEKHILCSIPGGKVYLMPVNQ